MEITPKSTILFLFTSYPRWSETFLRQDLSYLGKTGWPFVGVSLYSGDCTPDVSWPHVDILHESSAGVKSHPQTNRFGKIFKKRIPRGIYTRLSLWKHRGLVRKLETYCINHHATHIHAEFADLGALVASEVARKRGISYSVGIHAFDIHATLFDLEAILKDAQFVTVCNSSALNAAQRHLPHLSSKFHLIYHGVNLNFWNFLPVQSSAISPVKFIFVGRLVPKKGINILLQALALLKQQKHFLPELTVVGDGPEGNSLSVLAEELQITSQLHWLGRCSQQRVQEELAHASALCVPSIITPDGDRDGIPNVILEAMATGVPVIASCVGAIADVVRENTGWPIQHLTAESLADTLWDFAMHEQQREERRLAARKLIEEQFDAGKLVQKRLELFASCVNCR